MTEEEQLKSDMQAFWRMPDGVPERIVLRTIQIMGIFSATTDGSEGRDAAVTAQARRNLGLEILALFERGQPVTHPSGQPLLTIYRAIREEATKPQEKPSDRRNRNDRYSDLDDDGDS